MLREVPVEVVARATRLPPRLLHALESDDAASFAHRTDALHAVRACATAIGLDAEDAALRYEEWLATQPPGTLPPPVREPGTLGRMWRRARRIPGPTWAVVGATLVTCAALLLTR
jgi:cytoskeletal protein RodZ